MIFNFPGLKLGHFFIVLIYWGAALAISWPWSNDSSSSSDSASSSTTISESSSTDNSESSTTDNVSSSSSTSYGSYQPYTTTCPSGNLRREANGISSNESEYLLNRYEITNKNLIDFLSNKANLSDFDAENFINDYSPQHNISIGLAFSGGGYRAMLSGAGQILALDNRFNELEYMGGLLQSASYLTGLSGGNWLVGTLVLNNWILVNEILEKDLGIWEIDDSIINPNGINLVGTLEYYYKIQLAISNKQDAGFDTSVTDIWGRALSFQFFPDSSGGVNLTWSGIRDLSNFQNYSMPFPIVVADGRTPNTYIISSNSTIYEFNPYEMGSWDTTLNSFMDTKYLGTEMKDDGYLNSSSCVVNFDNAGFVLGTSSSLFNQIIIRLEDSNINSLIKKILGEILSKISYDLDDIAPYQPNPFHGSTFGTSNSIVSNDTLFLVDGGEDLQNVPLYPLIQSDRDVDIIFAFDNSADTDLNWPSGKSLVFTYERQFAPQGIGSPFPPVPDVEAFLENGYNKKPVFFGCDAANLSSLIYYHNNSKINETDVPLVVYMPNSNYSYASNMSTFKLSYSDEEKAGMVRNGFEVSSRGNLTDDDKWTTCVGCAIIRRSQERLGIEQSDECKSCFSKYCYHEEAYDVLASYPTTLSTGMASSTLSSATKQSPSTSSHTSSKKSKASILYVNWIFVALSLLI